MRDRSLGPGAEALSSMVEAVLEALAQHGLPVEGLAPSIRKALIQAAGGLYVYIPLQAQHARQQRDEAIRALAAEGKPIHVLARRYGLSARHIYRILRKRA